MCRGRRYLLDDVTISNHFEVPKERIATIMIAKQRQSEPLSRFGKLGAALFTASLFVVFQGESFSEPRSVGQEPIFQDVTQLSQIRQGVPAASLAVEDANGDGYLDLLVFGADGQRDTLYLNTGNLVFQDATENSGFPETSTGYAGAWADANNDGLLDIVFASNGSDGLYLGSPSGRYEPAGASNIVFTSGGGAWIDFNLDNALDYVTYDADMNVLLYKNMGNGRFEDVAEMTGLAFLSTDFHAICAYDFERDGYADVFFGDGYEGFPNLPISFPSLWRNYGNEEFRVLKRDAGPSYLNNEIMMPGVGDFNRDGLFDLYYPRYGDLSTLELNNGDETFSWAEGSDPEIDDPLLDIAHYATGAATGDYNADGYLDIYLADRDGGFLYRGDAGVSFTDVTYVSGLNLPGGTTCPIWADMDNDLYVELLLIDQDGNVHVFRSEGVVGNTLVVVPITDADGDATDTNQTDNRTAVGTIIEVDLDGDGDFSAEGHDTLLIRDISAASAGRSQPRAHFGLGEAQEVAVRVQFPDGSIVTHESVQANQIVTVLDDNSGEIPPTTTPPDPDTEPTPTQPPLPPITANPTPTGEPEAGAWFQYIAPEAGIVLNLNTASVTVEDFDRDGLLDLYFCTMASGGGGHANVLFRNDGALSFTDVTEEIGLDRFMLDKAAALGDFNNDGIADLITGTGPVFGLEDSVGETGLYQSKPDGTYEEVAEALGMNTAIQEGALWVDIDNDNDLDFVTGIGMYRNDGESGFSGVSVRDSVPEFEMVLGILPLDYDRDNRIDILFLRVAIGAPSTLLLHNDGEGHFSDVTDSSRLGATLEIDIFAGGLTTLRDATAVDVNHDGYVDILVAKQSFIEESDDAPDGAREETEFILLLNDGQGRFAKVENVLPTMYDTRGTGWGDYDNDGDLDLVALSPFAHQLYQNRGNLSFTDVADREGLYEGIHLGKPVWADLDNDGDLDLIAPEKSYPGYEYEHLFENLGPEGSFLTVVPLTDGDGDATDENTSDDRTAVGARVEVTFEIEPNTMRTTTGWITAGDGSMGVPVAHFGLGKATQADVLVLFPDGSVVEMLGVAAGSRLVVRDSQQTSGFESRMGWEIME